MIHTITYETLQGTKTVTVNPKTLKQCTGLKYYDNSFIWEKDQVKAVFSDGITITGIIKFGKYDYDNYGFYVQWNEDNDIRKSLIYWAKNKSFFKTGE